MSNVVRSFGLWRDLQSGAIPWTTAAGVVAAFLLGVFIVFGVGIAGAEVLHNAAHDTRHGLAFPCH